MGVWTAVIEGSSMEHMEGGSIISPRPPPLRPCFFKMKSIQIGKKPENHGGSKFSNWKLFNGTGEWVGWGDKTPFPAPPVLFLVPTALLFEDEVRSKR